MGCGLVLLFGLFGGPAGCVLVLLLLLLVCRIYAWTEGKYDGGSFGKAAFRGVGWEDRGV